MRKRRLSSVATSITLWNILFVCSNTHYLCAHAWTYGATAPHTHPKYNSNTDTKSTTIGMMNYSSVNGDSSREETQIESSSRSRSSSSSSIAKVCAIEGLVELVYNETLDEYFYKDRSIETSSNSNNNQDDKKNRFWWRQDTFDLQEIRSNESYYTPEVSQGLYRRCSCGDVNTKNVNDIPSSPNNDDNERRVDNVWNREITATTTQSSNSDDDDDDRLVDLHKTLSFRSLLCPLEAQWCALVHKPDDNRFDKTHAILGNELVAECYTMDPSVGLIRNAWPIMWMCYCFLILGLACTSVGNQALHYLVIRVGSVISNLLFCCCKMSCCCCSSREETVAHHHDNNDGFRQRYNQHLVQRMITREARQRRADQQRLWANSIGRNNTTSSGTSHRPTRRRFRWATFPSSSRGQHQSATTVAADDVAQPPEQAPSNGNHEIELSSQTVRSTYRELRRMYGVRELSLRTKIYNSADYHSNTNNTAFCKIIDSHQDLLIESDCDIEQQTAAFSATCSESDGGDGESLDDSDDKRSTISSSNRDISKAYSNCDDDSDCDTMPNAKVDASVEKNESTIQTTEEPPICIICYVPFREGDKIGDLPYCNHVFHSDCLKQWIARKNTCPMCLKPIAKPTSLGRRRSNNTRRSSRSSSSSSRSNSNTDDSTLNQIYDANE